MSQREDYQEIFNFDIKNKLTVTRGEVGGNNGGKGEKGFQEHI